MIAGVILVSAAAATMDEKRDLNTGSVWSEMDVWDLKQCLRFNDPPLKIATFLCRTEPDVLEKMRELRLGPFGERRSRK
jgi:hypothetical protein